jgi:hypothetical protein
MPDLKINAGIVAPSCGLFRPAERKKNSRDTSRHKDSESC